MPMPLEPHHGHCGSAGQRERHGVAGMRPVRQRGLARGVKGLLCPSLCEANGLNIVKFQWRLR